MIPHFLPFLGRKKPTRKALRSVLAAQDQSRRMGQASADWRRLGVFVWTYGAPQKSPGLMMSWIFARRFKQKSSHSFFFLTWIRGILQFLDKPRVAPIVGRANDSHEGSAGPWKVGVDTLLVGVLKQGGGVTEKAVGIINPGMLVMLGKGRNKHPVLRSFSGGGLV